MGADAEQLAADAVSIDEGIAVIDGASSSVAPAAPAVQDEVPEAIAESLWGPIPLDQDLSNWSVSNLGYIRHNHAQRDAGRVTFFSNSISQTCYMHSKCSVVRSKHRYSQEYMLRWLLLGEPCSATASAAERREAGDRHRQAFRNIA